jgi:hypothetical protein
MALSQKLFDAIVDGKAPLAQSLVEHKPKAGVDPVALISETMIPGHGRGRQALLVFRPSNTDYDWAV